MILYGKNSIIERLKANPTTIKKIFLQDNFNNPFIEDLIKRNKIPFERLSPRGLFRIKSAKDLQGIVARVERFAYVPYSELLNVAFETRTSIVFLDRINDPQNLGGIIRILACLGGFSIVIPQHGSCEVTEAVLHVASGGENYVSISKVPSLLSAIVTAKKMGYWIVGAEVDKEAEDINKVDIPFPVGLVFGSETNGLRYGTRKQLDLRVRIPMEGAQLSFNVATACAILCYEISKRKFLLAHGKKHER